jgi:hypothetical protein
MQALPGDVRWLFLLGRQLVDGRHWPANCTPLGSSFCIAGWVGGGSSAIVPFVLPRFSSSCVIMSNLQGI